MQSQDLSKYSDPCFRRLTGVSRGVYTLMLSTLMEYEQKHRSKTGRKSKINLENQLLLTLLYWKNYGNLLFFAHFWNVHLTTIDRIIKKVERILGDSGQFDLPEKDLSETQEQTCLVDTTEVEIQRPTEHQEEVYSGKKKKHTFKFQIIICQLTGMILQVVGCKGKVHDYQLFKDHLGNYSKEICFLADSGYQGLTDLFPNSFTPFKRSANEPLSEFKRICNQHYAKIRIKVEHKIRSIKIFRIFSTTYRGNIRRLQQQFTLIAGIRNVEIRLSKI